MEPTVSLVLIFVSLPRQPTCPIVRTSVNSSSERYLGFLLILKKNLIVFYDSKQKWYENGIEA